jgi:hypothetical protein
MKFIVHFFLEKPDPKAMQGQNLGAHWTESPDLKVALEEAKEEADALGADVFELESDNGSIKQQWSVTTGNGSVRPAFNCSIFNCWRASNTTSPCHENRVGWTATVQTMGVL